MRGRRTQPRHRAGAAAHAGQPYSCEPMLLNQLPHQVGSLRIFRIEHHHRHEACPVLIRAVQQVAIVDTVSAAVLHGRGSPDAVLIHPAQHAHDLRRLAGRLGQGRSGARRRGRGSRVAMQIIGLQVRVRIEERKRQPAAAGASPRGQWLDCHGGRCEQPRAAREHEGFFRRVARAAPARVRALSGRDHRRGRCPPLRRSVLHRLY